MKKKIVFGIILSIVFTYLAFMKVDLKNFLSVLRNVKYQYTIPVIFLNLAGFVLRAYRWKYILEPVKVIKTRRLFSSVMISFMANNILPIRLGEFVRAYSIGKMENISKSSAFATIVIERILDVFFMLFLFMILLFLFPFALYFPENLIKNSYYFLFFSIVFLLFLLFIMWKREFVLDLIEKILKSFPQKVSDRIQNIVDSFIKGLDFFRNTRNFVPIVILTIIMWIIYMSGYYFGFFAFKFFTNDFYKFLLAGVVLLVVGSIGLMIPSAPGAIGTYHSFCILGLLITGLNDIDQTAAFAVYIHGANYISVILVGLFYFFKENMHFSDLKLSNEKS
jgi:hypothetical protein